MTALRTWLAANGLEPLHDVFAANDIDFDVLRELAESDLEKIGLTLGQRKKVLKAVAALPPPSGAPSAAPEAPTPAPAGAEQRQLTVMFCDLVGSTALSTQVDLEQLRAAIRAFQDVCAGAIARFDGFVAKFMGDGVLAYFGYPKAHENEAERAVYSALRVLEDVARLPPVAGIRLEARIGIATGMVLVGELIGSGTATEQTVIGETPNLAARLQALAKPGTAVIGEATRDLIGNLFELADLGEHALKGMAQPVRAWSVSSERLTVSHFEATTRGTTELVGRDDEIQLLLGRWELSKNGEGQVVLLSGEPGLGKSRLLADMRRRLEGEAVWDIRYQCSPYHANSAFYPVITQLEHVGRIGAHDPPMLKRAKLEQLLALATERTGESLPYFASLLSIPAHEGLALPAAAGPLLKARTLDALMRHLTDLAARRPTLLVVEDVHWIDPSTAELLDRIVAETQAAPVMTLITFRPEYRPSWSGFTHVTALALNRLSRRQCAAMVERVTGGKALPDVVLDQILAKTDGIPLFVEELTKTVLESGLLRETGDRYSLEGPLLPVAIPATLRDSLLARLDRLAPIKQVAQVGAAIGREFSYKLMAAVAGLGDDELSSALAQLAEAELVFVRGTPPESVYTFKHALVQDAAYATLLKSRRAQLHASIAESLPKVVPNIGDNQPELLAHHYTEAGDVEAAVAHWLKAGRRAAQRAANREAIHHLSRGRDLLRALPASRARDEKEVEFLLALGIPQINAKGYTAPETIGVYAEARALCDRIGDTPLRFPVAWGEWTINRARMDMHGCHALVEELKALAHKQSDESRLYAAMHAEWATFIYQGEVEAARAVAAEADALYTPEKFHNHVAIFGGHDPGVCCRTVHSAVLWMGGDVDRAIDEGQRSLALGKELRHAVSIVHGLDYLALLNQYTGDAKAVIRFADEAIKLARELGLPAYVATSSIFRAWALARLGEPQGKIEEIRQALATKNIIISVATDRFHRALLAEVHAGIGDYDGALVVLDEALADLDVSGMRQWESELHRLKGEYVLLRAPAEAEAAARHIEQALAIAAAQKAGSLELRAAMSLARLWSGLGRRPDAQRLLAARRARVSGGAPTADVRAADALLRELA